MAIDDAGSGYSGLTRILKLAPDFIKLDRELVSGIDLDPVRRALVTSLVAFAADTGAEILAEGVETADELEAVRHLGVRYAQGYYLDRMLSAQFWGLAGREAEESHDGSGGGAARGESSDVGRGSARPGR